MKQNEKGLMQWEKDFLISVTILIIATIIAHIFFYQTAHNINVPMIYTLATFFISRYTKGYGVFAGGSSPSNTSYPSSLILNNNSVKISCCGSMASPRQFLHVISKLRLLLLKSRPHIRLCLHISGSIFHISCIFCSCFRFCS